jgi:hypothetical protein
MLLLVLLLVSSDALIRVPLSREKVRVNPLIRRSGLSRWDGVLTKKGAKWTVTKANIPKVPMLNDENEAWIGNDAFFSSSSFFFFFFFF